MFMSFSKTESMHLSGWKYYSHRNQKTCKQEMVIIQEVDVRPTNTFVDGY